MTSFQGAVIVVTGAGCGIGRATALAFSRLGAKLILADIQREPLAIVAGEISASGGVARTFPLDVSDQLQVESLARTVLDEFGNVDVVINNAGVLIYGETRLVSLEDFRWLMGVNFWGVVHLVHFFLPSMINRKQGHFVNISSANGLAPMPYVGPYSASKSAVVMLSETLRIEAARFGVGVTTVCPGLTRTELRPNAKFRTDTEAAEKFLLHFRERVKKNEIDPVKVARRIPPAVLKNKAFIRISPETYFLSWFYRFFPGLIRRITQAVVKRTG